MPFVPPKPGGWNLEDKLTAAQMTALQAAIIAADAAVLTQQAVIVRKDLASRVLSLRQITRAGVAITDSAVSMAAIQTSQLVPIVAMKIGNAMLCDDADRFVAGGALTSITSLANVAANNGTRIVVMGTGGTGGCTSTNNGASWAALGAGISGVQDSIVYDPSNGRFVASSLGSVTVYRSTTGAAAWSSATLPGGATAQSLAVLFSPTSVVALVDLAGVAKFCISTDGGATFAAAAGGLPSTPFGDNGSIAGNNSIVSNAGLVFHVARINSLQMQVSSSPDGLVWTALATFTVPSSSGSYSARPRILMCPNTGLLVIIAPHSAGMSLVYASEDFGQTWCLPKAMTIAPAGFAVAGGRLFATDGIMLLASGGIGYP